MASWLRAPGGAGEWSCTAHGAGAHGGAGPGPGRSAGTNQAALPDLGGSHAPGVRHRRASVSPLRGPAAPDRHVARSRGHPEDPRAPRALPLGQSPGPATPDDDKAMPARMPRAGHDRKGKKVSFRRPLRTIFPPDSRSLSTCLTVLFLLLSEKYDVAHLSLCFVRSSPYHSDAVRRGERGSHRASQRGGVKT
jgi:hypothetical protein